MGQGCSQPGSSAGLGGCWGVHGAGSSVTGLFTGLRAQDLLSCLLLSSGLGLCHLSLCCGRFWDLLPLPSQPSTDPGWLGSLKAAGGREPEHRAQGWQWEHSGEGQGCPLCLSKSMLGLNRSKTLPSFVLAQQQSWTAGAGAGPPQASSGMLQQAMGKAKHPQKLGTAWRELGAAKPSRKA